MNDNLIIMLAIGFVVIIAELGGIWIINKSKQYTYFSKMKKIGISFCILGIAGLILGLIDLYLLTRQ